MTIDAINSILFPPFLFLLFFSIASAFLAQGNADETKTTKMVRPAIASSPQPRPSQSSPGNSRPQWMRLREVLDEEESEQGTGSDEPNIPQTV
ncbi:MAG: hypothetical protein SW833_13895 [Cyanobacteriota bacterium]|nr:hypothetical protein [Cyanobacteriota bacterium]